MTIAIDILTIQRDELLTNMEVRVETRNRLIKNIASIEEQMDKDLKDLVSINRTIEFLEKTNINCGGQEE